jgi:hypothetical protein
MARSIRCALAGPPTNLTGYGFRGLGFRDLKRLPSLARCHESADGQTARRTT